MIAVGTDKESATFGLRPTRNSARRLGLAVVFLIVGTTAACSTSDTIDAPTSSLVTSTTATPTTAGPSGRGPAAEGAAPEVAQPGTYAVGTLETTIVDDTRVTPAQGEQKELPNRTLRTVAWYPSLGTPTVDRSEPNADPVPGPWPLIVFSHGLNGWPEGYQASIRVWASAGYVVLAPEYPLSNRATPGGAEPMDFPNQADDIGAIVDWAEDPTEPLLTGLIDDERVAAVGHSLGGFTSLTAGYDKAHREPRLDAVVSWAGAFAAPKTTGRTPLLIVHGDADPTVAYSSAGAIAKMMRGRWWMLTLVGGSHTPPYVSGLSSPQSTAAVEGTLDFLDAMVKDDAKGIRRLRRLASDVGPDVAVLDEGGS